ncbi:MAG: AAA family ATPase, partial [Methylococcaceae bacterium]|nr:AAA family ATPase [Methylococcaceae bacterium]
VRAIFSPHISLVHYEDLIASGQRLFDAFHWLNATEVEKVEEDVRACCTTAELVLDEFEKVESIRQQANQALSKAQTEQQRIFNNLFTDSWKTPQEFVEALDAMRRQQGHLSTIKELRYIDQAKIEQLQENLGVELDKLGQATVKFLNSETALASFYEGIDDCLSKLEKTQSTVEIEPLLNQLVEMSKGVDVLNETLAALKVDDTNVRTAILESLSSVYAKLNQAKASMRHKSKSFRSDEAVAEFAAQFKLFSQSINSALETVTTPQQCDDQLSRLLTQLEELESRFSDFDEFLNDIIQQREQLFDTFKTRKQALLDERQRRVQNINNAVTRILDSIQRRSTTFSEQDGLNTYLASDAMVLKLQQLIEQLQELEASVQADDAASRLKSIKDQAIRSLRDQADIFEDGGAVIKFGKHRFSVNTQALDLTLINRQDSLVWHLIGTDFFEPIENEVLNDLQDYWEQALISETPQVYRAEYLAASVLYDSEQGLNDLNLTQLQQANEQEGGLLELVKQYATPRYQEGYEKGIHDVDACEILKPLLSIRDKVGLLRYTPENRALAMLLWCFGDLSNTEKQTLKQQAISALLLQQSLSCNQAMQDLIKPLAEQMLAFDYLLPNADENAAADYLLRELAAGESFISSQQAQSLETQLSDYLHKINHRSDYEAAMNNAHGELKALWQLTSAWLQGLVESQQQAELARFIPETVMIILGGDKLKFTSSEVSQQIKVENLMGEHTRIQARSLNLSFDDFLQRLKHHREVVYPNYQRYQSLRQELISEQRDGLHLDAYQAKPLTSFVRNKLINDVYLPIVGDNLAKQMGTIGKNKRTDLMGLLLLISPPGYGKTTLMEYIADRLGLVFMKINCPSLGHDVHSLDPTQAPNATAAQELEKLNFGLEMGNNVMLYLDDIQHTHAEFLQKFISLCDGSRRIEGIWKGKSKTYDMRGKKFCVVMA